MTVGIQPQALAKSRGGTRSLIGHSLDVAHAAKALLSFGVTRERLSTLAGLPLSDVHVARLAVLAGLHDTGKACVGFQRRLAGRPGDSGHLAEFLVAMAHPGVGQALGAAMRGSVLVSWCVKLGPVLDAIIGHHGGPIDRKEIDACASRVASLWSPAAGYDPITEVRVLADAIFATFPEAMNSAEKLPDDTRFEHAIAGLVMGADWIASSLPSSGPHNRPQDIAAVLTGLAWSGWHSGASHAAVLSGMTPHAAQVAALTLPLNHLAIIEAPTGTGKTEAALIWASRLAEARLVDGLYFAVPTRSAATELHARIGRVMSAAHPALKGKIVRAIPGLVDTADGSPSWALGSTRKTQSAPIAVGSVDQALLSQVLNKHAWMRSLWLKRQLLVIDEVHASDAYMSELLLQLVGEHKKAGGYVLAMSATLGEALRSPLEGRQMFALAQAIAQPYPLMTAGAQSLPTTAPGRTVNVQIQRYSAALADAESAARAGQAVLWIRSTVANAIEDWTTLQNRDVPVLLHHSRFADDDRSYLDRQVLGVIGRQGQRRGVVIVATQTVEQSLDIDSDLLVTDACPADVMLQRVGRLYRHRQGTPTAIVIDPGNWEVYVGPARFEAPQRWHYVYSPLMVRATTDWLKPRGAIRVPHDVRDLVERVTHPNALTQAAAAYGLPWQGEEARLSAAALVARQQASAGLIDLSRHYRDNQVYSRTPTRIGDGAIEVPVNGLVSPFTGQPLGSVPIRENWLAGVPFGTIGVAAGRTIDVDGRRFSYDVRGLQK
jgi:CRISPR-associated endonuclease/helicase Cas3